MKNRREIRKPVLMCPLCLSFLSIRGHSDVENTTFLKVAPSFVVNTPQSFYLMVSLIRASHEHQDLLNNAVSGQCPWAASCFKGLQAELLGTNLPLE